AATAAAMAAAATQERVAAETARAEAEAAASEAADIVAQPWIVVDELPVPPADKRSMFLQGVGLVFHDGTEWRRIDLATGQDEQLSTALDGLYAFWDFEDADDLGRDRMGNYDLLGAAAGT